MTSPYLNTYEVAVYVRFVKPDGSVNIQAALQWIYKHIPPKQRRHRGRALLVHREDVDQALTRDPREVGA